jgi:hypothetical protein
MYKHPEYEQQVAEERYRFIREDFLRTRTPRSERPARLCNFAHRSGRLLIWLGMRLVRYGHRPETVARTRSLPLA